MSRHCESLATSLALLGIASSVHAQRNVYVDRTALPGGNGTSWARAFRELDVALESIRTTNFQNAPGVRVFLAQGTYRPTMHDRNWPAFSIDGYSQLTSSFSISLIGSLGGLQASDPYVQDYVRTPTILSGDVLGNDGPDSQTREDNRGPILYSIANWNSGWWGVNLDGIIFRGGRSSFATAGGVHLELQGTGRRASITNCRFEDNQGFQGGGLYIRLWEGVRADVDLYNCVATGNLASGDGGAFYLDGTTYVRRTQLTSNSSATSGGAVYSARSAYLTQALIAGNRAVSGGGAYGFVSCSGSLFAANHADVGGSAFLFGGDQYMNTYADNSAEYGGALHLSGYGGMIASCILSRNHAQIAGPQISHSEFPYPLQLLTTVVEGGASQIFGPFGGTLAPTSTIFTFDPRFVDLEGPDGDPSRWEDNNYHLAPNSHAIDVTNYAYFPFDLDGRYRPQPRIVHGTARADLGCYEYQPHCPADINQDGGITVDDLLAFLTAYTFGLPLADIDDGSGTNTPDDGVTVEDLLYFLARYNEGC